MVETHRATFKINKQQNVKGLKTVTQVPEQRGGSLRARKLTHTNTHSK